MLENGVQVVGGSNPLAPTNLKRFASCSTCKTGTGHPGLSVRRREHSPDARDTCTSPLLGDRIPGPVSSLPPGVRRVNYPADILLFPPHPFAPTKQIKQL